jgi:hypothetical protein
MSYNYITNLHNIDLKNKSVLIIGAGYIANEYALSLSSMGIKNVTILSKSEKTSLALSDTYGFKSYFGGYEKILPILPKMDLVIVATPVLTLLPAAECALENGQTNILIEKPGSLYFTELESLSNKYPNSYVRIAYNRLQYPNFHLLKQLCSDDGGITSCTFTFTEWLDRIDLTKYSSSILERWGISNSNHVISMAFQLIGLPKILTPHQFGSLDWHKSGSIFVGSGISEENIPFSYHADWNSSGRWGIEIMTNKNSYRLISLEELYVCRKNSTLWEKIPFQITYPDLKPGLSEQLCLMLDVDNIHQNNLISLEKSVQFNKVCEKIFGYI